MADVSRLGILGTPTVYVNGKVLNDRSLQGFQTAIEGELKK
jgi:protein-disulfide isomerase